jgi:hydroxylamine reductase (hybrid-cluster protein)
MAWINIAVLLPSDIVNSQLVFINLFVSANTTPQDHFACTTIGVCGKMAKTAAIQDTLMDVVKTVSLWCPAAQDASASADDLQAAYA